MAVIVASCGHSDSFRVNGVIDDGATINLRVVYYTDGNILTGITASKEGKFMYEGKASKPCLIEIYDNDYRILARMAAQPGEDIDLKINRANPYLNQVKGNKISDDWSAFLNANAEMLQSGAVSDRNALIAKYVAENPSNPAAEFVLITEYDASAPGAAALADSLYNGLAEEVRALGFGAAFAQMLEYNGKEAARAVVTPVPYLAHGGKTEIFKPSAQQYSLLCFSDNSSGRDSLVSQIREMEKSERKGRFKIADFSTDADTMLWHSSTSTDSAKWTQGWVAGGISAQAVARLGIPSIPYAIIADSAGHQIWRGSSISKAKSQLDSLLKR